MPPCPYCSKVCKAQLRFHPKSFQISVVSFCGSTCGKERTIYTNKLRNCTKRTVRIFFLRQRSRTAYLRFRATVREADDQIGDLRRTAISQDNRIVSRARECVILNVRHVLADLIGKSVGEKWRKCGSETGFGAQHQHRHAN